MRSFAICLLLPWLAAAQPGKPFVIRVTDDATGRGVPLVELRTLNEIVFITDSSGIAAIADPVLLGHAVVFKVHSHGYEFQHKFLDFPGVRINLTPGAQTELKLHRLNIAERMYRITGAGIYQDSVAAGFPVPIEQPLLNGGVLGQDTAATAIYRGRIFWIWGDTLGLGQYNFAVSAATSDLPGHGGLDPSAGINLHYFTAPDSFTRRMLPLKEPGTVWIQGLLPVRDDHGIERLLATYTRQAGLVPPLECGIALFDDAAQVFEPWARRPCVNAHISSHPFLHSEGGREYWYLCPLQRIPNQWEAFRDPHRWETFSSESRNWQPGENKVDIRDPQRFPLLDVGSGKPSGASASCVVWNEFRKRWILLAEKVGDVYYSEADQPEGPWTRAVLIVHHDHYNFYNLVTHDFFNQKQGRVIYFEGTYTTSFSDAKQPTPRYDYNQLMYRLTLDDPCLKLVP